MMPEPSEYNIVRKAEIDLCNDLLRYNSWDATELQFPHIQLLEEEEYQSGQDQLVQADKLAVDIKAKDSLMDRFIDDIIDITIDDPKWMERFKNAALFSTPYLGHYSPQNRWNWITPFNSTS